MDGATERVAEIQIDEVVASRQGFTLTGQGSDRAEYHLDLRFEMPLDARTRTVLGELLSQSELTVSRRAPGAFSAALRRPRRDRTAQGESA